MASGPPFLTLISADDLSRGLDRPDWAVLDVRFDLMNPAAGRADYLEAHVPGAAYVHLAEDLSGPPLTDRGRHPLPSPETLRDRFGRLGIGPDTQVVAYDQGNGAVAARAWWLLRYVGHDRVAVLDGGWRAWRESGRSVADGNETRAAADFGRERSATRPEWLVTVDRVPEVARLVDARDPARYRGETEPLDPVAGHIPGAVNHWFGDNLGPDGRFLSPAALRERMLATLGDVPVEDAAFYCGSGVTACHDLLALAVAGLPPARLYAGSWSEWCSDPARPVARGPDPR